MHSSHSIAPWTTFLLVEAKTDKNAYITSFLSVDNEIVLTILKFLRIDLVEDNRTNFSITFYQKELHYLTN